MFSVTGYEKEGYCYASNGRMVPKRIKLNDHGLMPIYIRQTEAREMDRLIAELKTDERDIDRVLLDRVIKFLEHIHPLLPASFSNGSYYLKHVIEKALDVYVPNGVAIAAAVILSQKYKVTWEGNSLNAVIKKKRY